MTELDVDDAGSSKIYEVRLSLICPRGSLSSEGLGVLLDSEYLDIAKAAAAPANAAPTAVTMSLVLSFVADDMILVCLDRGSFRRMDSLAPKLILWCCGVVAAQSTAIHFDVESEYQLDLYQSLL